MKSRCHNPNHNDFKYYGARGVVVCDEWKDSFLMFEQWAKTNGYSEYLTIDRFPNKYGIYEPSNCRWATMQQQNKNKSPKYNRRVRV
jgi:hypothetical protein